MSTYAVVRETESTIANMGLMLGAAILNARNARRSAEQEAAIDNLIETVETISNDYSSMVIALANRVNELSATLSSEAQANSAALSKAHAEIEALQADLDDAIAQNNTLRAQLAR